jgi:DNA-binding response OmpR family regulator
MQRAKTHVGSGTGLRAPVDGSRNYVVIVEDDLAIADVYGLAVSRRGFRVALAHDGDQGLALILDGPRPDLIVLDLSLPKMDGLDVLASLQKARLIADIPVVVLSNRATDFATAFHLGAVACLFKAETRPSALVDRLESLLGLQRTKRPGSWPASANQAENSQRELPSKTRRSVDRI